MMINVIQYIWNNYLEYVLLEIPYIMILFLGGLIIDHFLEYYLFKYMRKQFKYEVPAKNHKDRILSGHEILFQFILLAMFVSFLNSIKVYTRPLMQHIYRHAWNYKQISKPITTLMYAFMFFFTQDNLKKKLGNISKYIRDVLPK